MRLRFMLRHPRLYRLQPRMDAAAYRDIAGSGRRMGKCNERLSDAGGGEELDEITSKRLDIVFGKPEKQ